ncbi:translation elongation factor Ts [Candidatus Curtissbacteria bacterium]|nr:translation elongation factor Ts [Candidatus Curtissbacteria bacterium]
MRVSLGDIKKLREKTGAGIADCRRALAEAGGDFGKARDLIKSWGATVAAQKANRAVGAGLVETYIHGEGRVGAMVELRCETDFVARTAEFKNLAHEVAMQIAAMDPVDVEELLKQEYIKAKVRENIQIKRFIRFELGG